MYTATRTHRCMAISVFGNVKQLKFNAYVVLIFRTAVFSIFEHQPDCKFLQNILVLINDILTDHC